MGSPDKSARIPDDARKILVRMAAEWRDIVDPQALQVVPLKGAMTNEVYQIKWIRNSSPEEPLPRSKKVLVRIYGAGVDVFFARENEIRTFEFVSKQGQGPRLLGRFANGRVEEFIHARSRILDSVTLAEGLNLVSVYAGEPDETCRTLSAADLRDPEISAIIASKMKEFHDLDMPGSKKIVLWDRLRKWVTEAKRVSSPQEAKEFRLGDLEAEISALEKKLYTNDRIGFCHNDLQYGNIMMDEETRSITIIVSYRTIYAEAELVKEDVDVWELVVTDRTVMGRQDYEYASYNPMSFDIANHFCEMAADYHTETPHVLDYNKYPDLQERDRFLRVYLAASGKQPRDSEVKQLNQEVEKYTLASHLVWGLWGLISAHVNDIDFDYVEYARQRFRAYWAKKREVLGDS
ncbi:hypothetical protein SASPL_141975 [Salvia splendens]|uniref:Choline/ethanolamine kinase n=1 Tax=Salvia splendens TaxID=180675 RepID=A0A8X8Z8N0_SALSN|nr:hypothetical protein SASPL_141975 [Salvia splendens]